MREPANAMRFDASNRQSAARAPLCAFDRAWMMIPRMGSQ